MDVPRPQRNRIHINLYVPYDQAEPRIRAALAAGGHIVTDQFAPSWWVLADSEGNEVCVAPIGWEGDVPKFTRSYPPQRFDYSEPPVGPEGRPRNGFVALAHPASRASRASFLSAPPTY